MRVFVVAKWLILLTLMLGGYLSNAWAASPDVRKFEWSPAVINVGQYTTFNWEIKNVRRCYSTTSGPGLTERATSGSVGPVFGNVPATITSKWYCIDLNGNRFPAIGYLEATRTVVPESTKIPFCELKQYHDGKAYECDGRAITPVFGTRAHPNSAVSEFKVAENFATWKYFEDNGTYGYPNRKHAYYIYDFKSRFTSAITQLASTDIVKTESIDEFRIVGQYAVWRFIKNHGTKTIAYFSRNLSTDSLARLIQLTQTATTPGITDSWQQIADFNVMNNTAVWKFIDYRTSNNVQTAYYYNDITGGHAQSFTDTADRIANTVLSDFNVDGNRVYWKFTDNAYRTKSFGEACIKPVNIYANEVVRASGNDDIRQFSITNNIANWTFYDSFLQRETSHQEQLANCN